MDPNQTTLHPVLDILVHVGLKSRLLELIRDKCKPYLYPQKDSIQPQILVSYIPV
jgi:hypothetical protein